jgi:hypothetical protein
MQTRNYNIFNYPLIWTNKILYRISVHSMWQITTKLKVVHWHFVIDKHCDRAIKTLNYTPIITHVTLVYIGVIFLLEINYVHLYYYIFQRHKDCCFFFMAIFYQGRKYSHWLIHNPSRFVFKSTISLR